MKSQFRVRLLPLLIGSLLAVSTAYAQQTSSALSGRVVDAAGNPVAGATVEIIHVPSGTSRTVVTDANGRYTAQGLRVGGPFEVKASGDHGEAADQKDIYLRLAEESTLNLIVGAGATQELESIVVRGVAPGSTFQSDNKGVSTNLSQRALQALPQPDRSIQNVVRADPRIVVTDRDRGAFSAMGQNFRYNAITVDTVNAGDPFGLNDNGLPTKGSPISPDAIEEYNISTANYDVSTRRGAGAVVNAVTKSGTNEFHGSAYYSYTNADDLTGENEAGNKWTGWTSKYTAGATLGGPIIKDTLFFFLSYEESKNKAPGSVWGPEGSGATNTVRDLTQQQVDEITSIAAGYGIDAGGTQASNVDLESKRALAKIDWNINDAHRLSFRASRTQEDEPIIVQGSSTRLNLSSNWYLFDKTNTSFALSLYDDWSSTFSTEASIGYNKFDQVRGPLNGQAAPEIIVRTTGTDSGTSVVLGSEYSSQANVLGVKTWNAYFAGNWFLGDHTVKAGLDYQRDSYYNLFLQRYFGQYEFNSIEDFASGTYRRYRLADPAPGYTLNNVAAVYDMKQYGLFLQDTWQATDRLSLMFGLRYDIPHLTPAPTFNPCVAAEPGTTGNFGVCGLQASTSNPNAAVGGYGLKNTDRINGGVLQPRVSFNYEFDTERLTQLRGGIGVFISNTPGVWMANPYSNNGVAVAQYDVNRLRTPTDPEFSADPNNQNIPGGALTTPGLGRSQMGVDLVDKHFQLPTVTKITLGFDRELPWWGLIGTAEYQRLNVIKAVQYQNLNLGAPTGLLPDGRYSYAMDPYAAPSSSNRSRYNANPSFGNLIYLTNTNKGESEALTLSIKKPFSDNWFGMLGFTASRATEVNPGTSSVAFSSYQNRAFVNPNDAEVSTSNYSVPRRVIASLSWQHKFFGDYTTQISTFFDGHSGTPYSWVFGNDMNGDSLGGRDLAYIPRGLDDVMFTGNSTAEQRQEFIDYINNDNYLSQYKGRVFKRNGARAPWINQIDLTFRQEIPGLFPAGAKGELRFDIFNLGNLINDKWGVERRASFPLTRNLANFAGVDPATGRYIYNIDQQLSGGHYAPNALPVNESLNPSQRWSILVTVRYTF